MDYIITKTGFESIRHNITFLKQTEPKGKNLAEAGHVRDGTVKYRMQGAIYLIKANVVRQLNVGDYLFNAASSLIMLTLLGNSVGA